MTFVATTKPQNPVAGEVWFDKTKGSTFIYTLSNDWVEITPKYPTVNLDVGDYIVPVSSLDNRWLLGKIITRVGSGAVRVEDVKSKIRHEVNSDRVRLAMPEEIVKWRNNE